MEDNFRIGLISRDFSMTFMRFLFCISRLDLLNLWCPDPLWLRKATELMNPMRAGRSPALAGLLVRPSTPPCVTEFGRSDALLWVQWVLRGGLRLKNVPWWDWATWGTCLPVPSSSLYSLTTGRRIWGVQPQRTARTWAKQSPFSRAAKRVFHCLHCWITSEFCCHVYLYA